MERYGAVGEVREIGDKGSQMGGEIIKMDGYIRREMDGYGTV